MPPPPLGFWSTKKPGRDNHDFPEQDYPMMNIDGCLFKSCKSIINLGRQPE